MISTTERFSVTPKEDSKKLSTKRGYHVLAIQKFGSGLRTYFLLSDENKELTWVPSDTVLFNRVEDVIGVEVQNG